MLEDNRADSANSGSTNAFGWQAKESISLFAQYYVAAQILAGHSVAVATVSLSKLQMWQNASSGLWNISMTPSIELSGLTNVQCSWRLIDGFAAESVANLHVTSQGKPE